MPCRLREELPSVSYPTAAAAEDGALLADGARGEAGEVDGSEVDELRWVVPAEALELLTYERDRDLVTAALAARD